MFSFSLNQIIRTTWAKLKNEDNRPDEGKYLKDDKIFSQKEEAVNSATDKYNTELVLLNPTKEDGANEDVEKSLTLNGAKKDRKLLTYTRCLPSHRNGCLFLISL